MSTGENTAGPPEEVVEPSEGRLASPLHGFQGDRAPAQPRSEVPRALTIAVSREAGSRGHTIGSRAGLKLGWPVYNQELLQYVAQEGAPRHSPCESLDSAT